MAMVASDVGSASYERGGRSTLTEHLQGLFFLKMMLARWQELAVLALQQVTCLLVQEETESSMTRKIWAPWKGVVKRDVSEAHILLLCCYC
jgi:hypothetical protein